MINKKPGKKEVPRIYLKDEIGEHFEVEEEEEEKRKQMCLPASSGAALQLLYSFTRFQSQFSKSFNATSHVLFPPSTSSAQATLQLESCRGVHNNITIVLS